MDSEDSDKDELLLALADIGDEATQIPIQKRKKRQWVREWRKNNHSRGSFAFLTTELQVNDESSYKNYLRLSKHNFDYLVSLVASEIQRSDTDLREAIPAADKVAI